MGVVSLDLNEVIAVDVPTNATAGAKTPVRKIVNSRGGVLWSTPSANVCFCDNLPVSISYFRNFEEPFSIPKMRAQVYPVYGKSRTNDVAIPQKIVFDGDNFSRVESTLMKYLLPGVNRASSYVCYSQSGSANVGYELKTRLQLAKLGGTIMSWPTSMQYNMLWDEKIANGVVDERCAAVVDHGVLKIDGAAARTQLDVDATGCVRFNLRPIDSQSVLTNRSSSTDVRLAANTPYYLKVVIPLELDSRGYPVDGWRTNKTVKMQAHVSRNGSDWQLAAETADVDVCGNTFFGVAASGKRYHVGELKPGEYWVHTEDDWPNTSSAMRGGWIDFAQTTYTKSWRNDKLNSKIQTQTW